MADVNIKLNNDTVLLRDVTDPGYVAPTDGYVIHLDTPQARQFVRNELQEVRAAKAERVVARDAAETSRLVNIARRDEAIAEKAAINAEIDQDNLDIAELVAFLSSQGDDTSE